MLKAVDDPVTSAARSRPDHPALETSSGTLTYGKLDTEANAWARRLAALGVSEGDRVPTTLPPGIEFAILLHAAPRLGAALVPLDTRLSAAGLRALRRDCGARLLVDEPLGGEEADLAPRATLDPGAIHTVVYTSGTSGRARGVELTVANHFASALASARFLGARPADRWLCVLPLFHVGGLAVLLRSATNATTAVVHEGFDPTRVREELEAGRVTLASLVPTMLHRLRDAGLERAPALRAALLGGGPIPAELLEWARQRQLPVAPTYGMTETASQIVTVPPADALRGVRAGRPLEGVQLRLAADGEILVRGPMVAPGAVGRDGWLHTGDLGRLDAEGRLTVTGRKTEVIVTGGENVIAGEVEEALREHPAVDDAGVTGIPDAEWGERIVAAVALRSEVSEEELIAHCRARLAPFQVPKEVHRRAELPRNAAGKLVRSELARRVRRKEPPTSP